MAKANGNHEQLLSSDYVTNMNTNAMGGMSSNSMSTTFPSNHHLLVRHTAIDPLPSISHSQSQLNGGNSFELNGVTTSSLSEDSGLPLTTNSSISSGDSTRMGLCKFEFELATESDAEVSQFDSLENCSDGGMSAENFNTLKKVPLAPIDPPPEFQDSPQTTLTRSKTLQTTVLQGFSTKIAKNIVSTAITVMNPNTMYDDIPTITLKTKSLEILPTDTDTFYDRHHSRKRNDYDDDPSATHIYQCEYHSYHRGHTHDEYNHYHTYDIYASDSILNTHIDNIYDVPCDEYPTNSSCGSLLAAESSDQLYVFNEAGVSTAASASNYRSDLHRLQMARANEIHDYELYYRKRTNKAAAPKPESATTTEPCSSATSTLASDTIKSTPTTNRRSACDTLRTNTDTNYSKSSTLSSMAKAKTSSSSTSTSMTTFQHRKTPSILYSPLHYHANSNLSTGNRPNSRNSLNSRLSSSHNSLTISSSHKADDSTAFITQAMSHDALTSRDISDFYNVPIDSDIYALPIDVIRPISSGCVRGASAGAGGSSAGKVIASGLSRSCIIRGALANAKGSAKILSEKIKATQGPMQSMPTTDMKQMPNNRTTLLLKNSTKRFRGRLKYVRNTKKRKRHQQLHATNGGDCTAGGGRTINGSIDTNERIDKRHSVPENGTVEPMRMTLDEVKRFYTSLHSSSSESALELSAITRNMSNANVCNHGGSNSGRLNKLAITTFNTFTSNKQSTNVTNNDNNNGNNNNNNNNNNNSIIINNNNTSKHNNNVSDSMVISDSDRSFNSIVANNTCTTANNSNHTNEIGVGAAGASSVIVNGKTSTATNTTATLQQTKLTNGRNFKKIASSSSISKESIEPQPATVTKKSQFSISLNLKQRFCSIFRFRKSYSTQHGASTAANHYGTSDIQMSSGGEKKMKFLTRALPPLPLSFKGLSTPDTPSSENSTESNAEQREIKKPDPQNTMDFAKNIEKVKEYGWYWGPISSEAAEKLLSNEPDGSFIVRDSSDDHYIFSLTFKLNNCVRHVRIEQDQGTFSFGSCAKFKSRTIMEFIENAVESSRSGRYLFFFHRRPEHGPMRVQLTNPVSRFKHIQSLQHMCRFVIRRAVVRKDLIQTLPLPRRLLDYLSYKNCYSEQIESDSSQSPQPSEHIVRDSNDEADDNVIMQ